MRTDPQCNPQRNWTIAPLHQISPDAMSGLSKTWSRPFTQRWTGERRWSCLSPPMTPRSEQARTEGRKAPKEPNHDVLLVSEFLIERLSFGGNDVGLLLLVEDELLRAMAKRNRLDGDVDNEEILVLPACVNSFVRMLFHETARRFQLESRSSGIGDERRCHIQRQSSSRPSVSLF